MWWKGGVTATQSWERNHGGMGPFLSVILQLPQEDIWTLARTHQVKPAGVGLGSLKF